DSNPMNSTTCLILDVRLPGMSGIELQRRLRAKNSGIPIIFVTAHGDASTRDRAMEDGAASFLNKPVRRQTLLDAIHAALERGQPGESPCWIASVEMTSLLHNLALSALSFASLPAVKGP